MIYSFLVGSIKSIRYRRVFIGFLLCCTYCPIYYYTIVPNSVLELVTLGEIAVRRLRAM